MKKINRSKRVEFLAKRHSPSGTQWTVIDEDSAEGFALADPKDRCTCGARGDIRNYRAILDATGQALEQCYFEPQCLYCADQSAEFYARELSDEITNLATESDQPGVTNHKALRLARNAHYVMSLQRFISKAVWVDRHATGTE